MDNGRIYRNEKGPLGPFLEYNQAEFLMSDVAMNHDDYFYQL